MVDRGPIYTELLFGAAMKKTDKKLLLVLRFFTATPFDVLVFYFYYGPDGLFRCVLVPGTLAFHLLYTLITCNCLVYSCLTLSDHIIMSFISLG